MPFAAADQPPPWRAPVTPVAVVRRYHEVAPFSAGGHRGIDLRASPGQRVGAPCEGRVTFRGSVAGGPPTVTIDCGTLRATLQRVTPSVAVGAHVGRGAQVGSATRAAVDLSARRIDGTYLDPARLLAVGGHRQPPGLVPPRARPRPTRPALTEEPVQRPARLVDRALVTPHAARATATGLHPPSAPVDLPLGLVGGALMLMVVAGWTVVAARRRRGGTKVARGASLARVQR